MNKYTYTLGALATALIIGGLPMFALADNNNRDNNSSFENSTTSVRSSEELRNKIEQRKEELDQEESEASTTTEDQEIVRHGDTVRLAVHALISSRDLFGDRGIGEEVSQIAKEMNDSVATTTKVEEDMHSRGFFTHLFFGGDNDAANVLLQVIAKNQKNIQKLTDLLNQANLSADVQTILKAQIAILQDEQARLQVLVQKEQNSWGLFNWHFFK